MDKKIIEGKNWYDGNIEKSMRLLVRAFRNNGINTECSCEHKNYIQCQSVDPTIELHDIKTVLMCLDIKNYKLELIRKVVNDEHYDSLTVYFEKKEIVLFNKRYNTCKNRR